MYKIIETTKEIKWGDRIVNPIYSIKDEYNREFQIVVDNNCFVPLLKSIIDGKYYSFHFLGISNLFNELFELIKTLDKKLLKK